MGRGESADRLTVLGLGVGALLVLVGLATLAGTPWTTAKTALAGVTQAVGAVLTVIVGVGLAWLARAGGSAA